VPVLVIPAVPESLWDGGDGIHEHRRCAVAAEEDSGDPRGEEGCVRGGE